MRDENSEQNIMRGTLPMIRQQQSEDDQGMDEFLLQEYEHFLSNKAEGTIDAYVRTIHRVIEWIAQRPGNGGRFHPRQLTKTTVEVYLASLEQHGFSLNHRARVKSTISSFARWLMEEKGLLQRNPTRGVDLPSQQVLAPRQLSEDQRYILHSLIEQEGDRRGLRSSRSATGQDAGSVMSPGSRRPIRMSVRKSGGCTSGTRVGSGATSI